MLKSKKNTYNSLDDFINYLVDQTGIERFDDLVEERNIQRNKQNIHVDIFDNSADSPTLLFIPGTGLHTIPFLPLLKKIYDFGFNVVGIDPIGHGRSDGSRGDYTISSIMADTRTVIEYAKQRWNDNIFVFGSSQGGITAFYLAALYPDLRGVICHCFADLSKEENVELTRYPRLFKYMKPSMVKIADALPSVPIPINTYLNLETIQLKHFGNIREYFNIDPFALQNISSKALASLAETRLAVPISDIKPPVYVFLGDRDEIFDLNYIKSIYNKIKTKKSLRIYPEQGHGMLTDIQDNIAADVSEWMNMILSSED